MITLEKAFFADCGQIHEMQITAFRKLLDQYQDTQTNPGAETLDNIERRMEQENSAYYFITLEKRQHIGVIRVVRPERETCRISPMFILPEFRGKGYAQEAIACAERQYPFAEKWELDTIKQEKALCHLYEKMGYRATGREEDIQKDMTIIYYRKVIRTN